METTPGQGGIGIATEIITTANASAANVGEVITGEVWFCGGGGSSSNGGNGRGTNCGGGGQAVTFTPAAGDAGCAIIRIPTSDFTGTTFTDDAGATINPAPGLQVQTLTQGDDTVIVFRSGTTVMTLA